LPWICLPLVEELRAFGIAQFLADSSRTRKVLVRPGLQAVEGLEYQQLAHGLFYVLGWDGFAAQHCMNALANVGFEAWIVDTCFVALPRTIAIIVEHDEPTFGAKLSRDRLCQVDLVPVMSWVQTLPLPSSHTSFQIFWRRRERQMLRL